MTPAEIISTVTEASKSSYAFTAVIVAISLLGPIIATLLATRMQVTIKKLEIKNQRIMTIYEIKQQIFFDFIHLACAKVYGSVYSSVDYERAYKDLFLFVSPVRWYKLKEFYDASDNADAVRLLGEVTELLQDELCSELTRTPL